jgi:predicted O-linked N-acetylglucosamine transferase (SPINDLY family)
MATDILSAAVLQSMARSLSVPDLIRTTDRLRQSGQANSVETVYAAWIQHNQSHPLLYAVLFNYSVTLSDSGKLEPARDCLERAISLNPDFMPAYINLGRVYERLGSAGLAVIQWSAALAKMTAVNGAAVTHKTTALNQAARALETADQDESAENLLRESLELDCHQREVAQHLIALRQRQCEWPVVLASERVDERILMESMSPLSAAAYTDDPLLQLATAYYYNKTDTGTPAGAMDSWPGAAGGSAPLRVGYLSSDLRQHALGYLMTEVFGLHDRKQVEVFAYYCGPEAQDALHQKFKATADHWVSIGGLDDAAAARRIAEDGIQILVDLNGYTRDARLKLVALRPAPVIVNWLGYPGTMASPYHHYIVADDWIIPESHEIYYSEQVLRLPCYQPSNRHREVSPRQPSRSEAGLPEDGMVYCCFNGVHKINRFTFDRWLMILARVPGSVLWLLSSTDATKERLRSYASQRGIAPERLVFAEKVANPVHLARYVLADLFLDTTPYGAHTTASDALWMGVPVLTLSGRSFASRVCGSLVRAAGIPEMVCTSAEEYVDRAVAFGNDVASLQTCRETLRAGRDSCTLFDMPSLVRHLEELYQRMWQQYEEKRLPRPDLANLDVYLEIGSQVKHEELEVQSIADYHGWWQGMLAQRNKFRPVDPDRRLVGQALPVGPEGSHPESGN